MFPLWTVVMGEKAEETNGSFLSIQFSFNLIFNGFVIITTIIKKKKKKNQGESDQGESGASLMGSKYSLSVELKEMEKSLLK